MASLALLCPPPGASPEPRSCAPQRLRLWDSGSWLTAPVVRPILPGPAPTSPLLPASASLSPHAFLPRDCTHSALTVSAARRLLALQSGSQRERGRERPLNSTPCSVCCCLQPARPPQWVGSHCGRFGTSRSRLTLPEGRSRVLAGEAEGSCLIAVQHQARCAWRGSPGGLTRAVCLAELSWQGSPGGLTWRGSRGGGAGPFSAAGDEGVAEGGCHEVGHKSHESWTSKPGGDSSGHTGRGSLCMGTAFGISPWGPFSYASFSTAENSSNPTGRSPTACDPGDGDCDPQGTFIRGWDDGADEAVPVPHAHAAAAASGIPPRGSRVSEGGQWPAPGS